MTAIILDFGKHKGEPLTSVPLDYVRWLANLEPTSRLGGGAAYSPIPAKITEAARALVAEKDAEQARKDRARLLLGGATHEGPDPVYIIECEGDCWSKSGAYAIDYQIFPTLEAALCYLDTEYPVEDQEDIGGSKNRARSTPDPEDDRILIWEVLPSGHRLPVWGFFGWHFSADHYACGQGTLPGDAEPLAWIANRQY